MARGLIPSSSQPTDSHATAVINNALDDIRAAQALDAYDMRESIVDAYAEGRTWSKCAKLAGVTSRQLWAWVHADLSRYQRYLDARTARAHAIVDDAHERTTALADARPEDAAAVGQRVKLIMWDAQRSSPEYADRSMVQSTVDVTVHLADDEISQRLGSLLGASTRVEDVVDGELVK